MLAATRHGFKIKIDSIRQAIKHVEILYPSVFSSKHPLVSKVFETDGCDLIVREIEEQGEKVVSVSAGGQIGLLSVMNTYLKRIDRDRTGWPLRVYPVVADDITDKSIVIVSNLGSGRPTIAKTSILVETIWGRAQAGEEPEELAEDYGIGQIVVAKAIDYFTRTQAA